MGYNCQEAYSEKYTLDDVIVYYEPEYLGCATNTPASLSSYTLTKEQHEQFIIDNDMAKVAKFRKSWNYHVGISFIHGTATRPTIEEFIAEYEQYAAYPPQSEYYSGYRKIDNFQLGVFEGVKLSSSVDCSYLDTEICQHDADSWYVGISVSGDVTVYSSVPGFTCPDGYYNDIGECKEQIFSPDECINIIKTEDYTHTNGVTTYIYVGRTWTYRAYRKNGTIVPYDETVILNYTGTVGTNGVNYIAPTTAIIPAGSSFVEFELTLLVDPVNYQQYVAISGSSSSLPRCGTVSNQILSDKSTPEYIEWDPEEPVFVVPPPEKPPVYFGAECDDDLFWEEKGCHDFFKYTPMKYIDKG